MLTRHVDEWLPLMGVLVWPVLDRSVKDSSAWVVDVLSFFWAGQGLLFWVIIIVRAGQLWILEMFKLIYNSKHTHISPNTETCRSDNIKPVFPVLGFFQLSVCPRFAGLGFSLCSLPSAFMNSIGLNVLVSHCVHALIVPDKKQHHNYRKATTLTLKRTSKYFFQVHGVT